MPASSAPVPPFRYGGLAGGKPQRAGERRQAARFPIYTFNGRPEPAPLAVGAQDQLKKLGYDISQGMMFGQAKFRDVTKPGGNWDAAIYSNDTTPSGDRGTASTVSSQRAGATIPPITTRRQLNACSTGYRPRFPGTAAGAFTANPGDREGRRTRRVSGHPPLITAFKKGLVRGYTPHPSDSFFLTPSLSFV